MLCDLNLEYRQLPPLVQANTNKCRSGFPHNAIYPDAKWCKVMLLHWTKTIANKKSLAGMFGVCTLPPLDVRAVKDFIDSGPGLFRVKHCTSAGWNEALPEHCGFLFFPPSNIKFNMERMCRTPFLHPLCPHEISLLYSFSLCWNSVCNSYHCMY